MSIIFTILMSLGFMSSPYQSDVKHNPSKFDAQYSDTVKTAVEWEEMH